MHCSLSLIITIFLSAAFLNGSQITGKVSQKGNNTPLQGANVLFVSGDGAEFGASCDVNGVYKVEDIVKGEYKVIVSFIGYEDFRDNVQIEEDKSYTINASLSISPILMAKLEIISKAENPYEDLPGAATVIDAQALKKINPIGTQEILEYVPGVSGFADDGIGNSRISIGIRGLNPRRSPRVLILEDGIPIQPAVYVYPNMYYNPPAERIDQVEVIKGSGSILYGPQTMGGVINYFTKRPRNEIGGLLKITGGENGYSSIFSEYGGMQLFGKKSRGELQLLYKRGDGFRENNAFQQFNSTFKVNYRQSDSKNVYVKSNINYENSDATYTGLTEWSFENDPNFNPKEDDNFEVFRAALDVIQTEKISSRISKSTSTFFNFFDRRWWREYDMFIRPESLNESNEYSAEDEVSKDGENGLSGWKDQTIELVRVGNGINNFGILRKFYVAGHESSYDIDHKLFNIPAKMNIGFRLYWERFEDDRKEGSSPTDRDGVYFEPVGPDSLDIIGNPAVNILGKSHHYETRALSGFVQESFSAGIFDFRPGLRFEVFEQERIDRLNGSSYQDQTEMVVLPGFSLSADLYGMKFFGGVHRGYTPPSSGAINIDMILVDYVDNGLDVLPEKSWNKEIGVKGSFPIVDFEVSGFHVDIENLIAAARATAFKNLGKVRTMGVESRASVYLSTFSSLLPNINVVHTFMDSEVIEGSLSASLGKTDIAGNSLPYVPRNTLIVGTESAFSDKVALRFDCKYVSKVYTDFENIESTQNKGIQGTIDPYTIFNLSANYEINKKINLFLSGKNILDTVYIGSRLHSNPIKKEPSVSSGILPGPRRQINVGIEYNL
tara:strand:- start:274 stop:2784 length:2511 start_codon:yes stop_codon:yes gene_type:complete